MSRLLNFIKRKINKIKNKIYFFKYEHKELFEGIELTYLFIPKRSRNLIIVFSGMNPNKAKYSYINALNGVFCDRLYILDNFGQDKLGCYYIGTDGNNEVEKAVKALLSKIITDRYQKVVFCGSSKGGFSALNFGLDYSCPNIIIGAPQYHLGYYLKHRRSPSLLTTIAGENPSESYLQYLDDIIKTKIEHRSNEFSGRIFIHFSDQEHTYQEHIVDLLSDLSANNICFEKNIEHYQNHDDVAIYFPKYLLKSLKKLHIQVKFF